MWLWKFEFTITISFLRNHNHGGILKRVLRHVATSRQHQVSKTCDLSNKIKAYYWENRRAGRHIKIQIGTFVLVYLFFVAVNENGVDLITNFIPTIAHKHVPFQNVLYTNEYVTFLAFRLVPNAPIRIWHIITPGE